MIWLNMLAATLIAAMAGLGIGGGGLLVIYLTLILGTEQLTAQGINLAFFIFSSLASLCLHFKKRKLNIKIISVFALTGIVGSIFGSYLAQAIDAGIIKKIFGGLLIISGLITLFSKNKKDISKQSSGD